MIHIKNKQLINSFGEHLRKVRKEKGMSQRDLAYTADVSISQISRIERGEVNVTISSAYAIATAMKITLAELFDFEVSD